MIRPIAVVILITFAIPGSALSQPDTLWSATYGGLSDDLGFCVEILADGFILAGHTLSSGAGNIDAWLIKADTDGNVQWYHTYGGRGDEYCHAVIATQEGGFLFTGSSNSGSAGDFDLWLVKTDGDGNILWERTFGGPQDDQGHRIAQTSDGGCIVAGETTSYGYGGRDFWIIKLNASNQIEWDQTYGGPLDEYVHAVEQTVDGGYFIAGPCQSFGAGSYDFWFVKLNAYGVVEWSRTYGGTAEDHLHAAHSLPGGGYAIAGCSWSFGAGGCDFRLIKIDPAGNEIWSTTYGGQQCDCCYDMRLDNDGGFIMCGWSQSFGAGNHDALIVKTDFRGRRLWSYTYGGIESDLSHCVRQTADNGYVIIGHTLSFGAGGKDAFLLRLDADSDIDGWGHGSPFGIRNSSSSPSLSIRNNPYKSPPVIAFMLPDADNLTLKVYDIAGREVATLVDGWRNAGAHSITFDGSGLSSGIYIYHLQTGAYQASGKMVLIK